MLLMTLQLYDLRDDCRDAGYNIVDEVQSFGPDISEGRMDELFQPLLEEFKRKNEEAAEQERDEVMGELEEREEENARSDRENELRSELSDKKHIVIRDEKQSFMTQTYVHYEWYVPKRDVQGNESIRIVRHQPVLDYDDLDYDDLINLSKDDKDDYMETIEIFTSSVQLGYVVFNNIENNKAVPSLQHLEIIQQSNANMNTFQTAAHKLLSDGWVKQTQLPSKSQSTCQRVIRAGKRTGKICHRTVKRANMCPYHLRKSKTLTIEWR